MRCMHTLYTDDQQLMNTPTPTVNACADCLLLWGDSAGTTGSSLRRGRSPSKEQDGAKYSGRNWHGGGETYVGQRIVFPT